MRTSFKHHQLRTMKAYFALNHNPDAKDLKQLAQKSGLTKRVLQVVHHWLVLFMCTRAGVVSKCARQIPTRRPIGRCGEHGGIGEDVRRCRAAADGHVFGCGVGETAVKQVRTSVIASPPNVQYGGDGWGLGGGGKQSDLRRQNPAGHVQLAANIQSFGLIPSRVAVLHWRSFYVNL
jgi:hypothetical protein